MSCLRRPLFLLLLAYIGVILVLHHRGRLTPKTGKVPEAPIGTIVSPVRYDRRGPKVVASFAGTLALARLPRQAPVERLRPGQIVAFEGYFRRPRSARNPGDFDEKEFLEDRDIVWVVEAKGFQVRVEPRGRWRLWAAAEGVRRSIEAALDREVGGDEARLLSAIALGYKRPLARESERAIQDAGVMHLLVPSGAKVAFVMLAVGSLMRRLSWRLLAAALAGGFYTIMVGADPPYARAYLSALALGIGHRLGRESGAFQAMTLSAGLILLTDPRALFSVGFQMSYLAMAGLVLSMPKVNASLPRRWPRPLRAGACVLAVTVVVEIMLWPLFAGVFGRGAVVGALANLPLVPASGLLMAGDAVLWALAGTPVARPAGVLMREAARAFLWACVKAAALPMAAMDLAPMSGAGVMAYYLVLAGAMAWPRRRTAAVLLAVSAALAACSLRRPKVEVFYLYPPGAGPAIVHFADGRTWVVGGRGPAGPASRALKALGFGSVDKLVLGYGESRSWERFARERRPASIERMRCPTLCQGAVCFQFRPPAVRRGTGEFDIIATRLKSGATKVSTDGFIVQVSDPLRR